MFDTNAVLSAENLRFRGDFAPSALAVFGKPIAHSLSPIMQNAALKELIEDGSVKKIVDKYIPAE